MNCNEGNTMIEALYLSLALSALIIVLDYLEV